MEIPTIEKIIEASGKHKLRVRNVYLYGSRVYDTATERSDWDIIVVSPSLLDHEELHVGNMNIHIIIPDDWKHRLYFINDITALECEYAPEFAKIQIRDDYKFIPDKNKLRRNLLTQSATTWVHAKYKFNSGDIYHGLKSGFHAIKILAFCNQICETDQIDFSSMNNLHEEIMNEDFLKWADFKRKYLPLKIEYEDRLKNFSIKE